MDILHCDLDAFYASVEQRDNPELMGKPVIIGGLPGTRGVVSTCSYEAREYGVHSAMPANQAAHLCPQAVFIIPEIKKYIEVSQQVFSIMARYSPLIEPLSIDEAFLDVSGCHNLFGSSIEIAQMIKKGVSAEAGLNISVGIAANKFLAKLATNLSKPDGLLVFGDEQIKELLPALPIADIWGIGKKTAARLNKAGIYTAGDLTQYPYKKLTKMLGSNTSFYIDLCRGIDTRPVLSGSERKSIGNEITFDHDLSDEEEIEQILLELSCQVGYRLRMADVLAHTVSIKLRTPGFQTISRSQTLSEGVDTDSLIHEIAVALYRKSGLAGKSLRLTGVSCSKLISTDMQQPSLFMEGSNAMDKIIDELNGKFGSQTIKRASLLNKRR